MSNSIIATVRGSNGVERDIAIEAVHTNPKRYGFLQSDDYRAFIMGEFETDEIIEFGFFHFSKDRKHWIYDGSSLTINEQEEIADLIQTYEEGDVSY